MRLLRASARQWKPWKNGGGETSDVFVWPEGAGLENFDLRVSVARVASDGPFSRFPGIDRTLTVLDGPGLDLTVAEDAPLRLTPDSAPFAFSGDDQAFGAVPDGAIHDCNVMTRRARFTHRVEALRLAAGEVWQGEAGETLLFLAEGEGELDGAFTLHAGDAVIGDHLRVTAKTAARLLIIRWDAV